MNEIVKCPWCGGELIWNDGYDEVTPLAFYECQKCFFACDTDAIEPIAAAMELARATRTLEDAMEPLNSGKLKMGQALPAIRLAMEDAKACEQRVLEVFK